MNDVPGDPCRREIRIPQPCVLFRASGLEAEAELQAAEQYFVTTRSRMNVTGGDLVIGRYSVLPFFKELENDLRAVGASLINPYRAHRYAADLQNYVVDLDGLTPRTWLRMEDVPDNVGAVVLKGETNSRKNKWMTHMFAKNKKEALKVWMRLQDDSFLSDQSIYIREYVPLTTYHNDIITQQPVTEEYRFFVLDKKIMSGGFYWSNHVDQLPVKPNHNVVPEEFLRKVVDRVGDNIRFYVIDVARTLSGDWMVVELNDGQMSGLSENSPSQLYRAMKWELWDSKVTIRR